MSDVTLWEPATCIQQVGTVTVTVLRPNLYDHFIWDYALVRYVAKSTLCITRRPK